MKRLSETITKRNGKIFRTFELRPRMAAKAQKALNKRRKQLEELIGYEVTTNMTDGDIFCYICLDWLERLERSNSKYPKEIVSNEDI